MAKRYFFHPFGPEWSKVDWETRPNHKALYALDINYNESLGDGGTVEGMTLYSMFNGVVHNAGYSSSAGNFVIIKTKDTGWSDWNNGKELYLYYMHLQDLPLVKTGDSVYAGTPVGKCGTTGDSTGPHLHVDIRQNGNWGKDDKVTVSEKMCSHYKELMDNKRVKSFISQTNGELNSSTGNGYNYFIFAKDPVFIGGSGSIQQIPGINMPEYYSSTIPDSFLTGGGYSLKEQKNRLAALCQREIGMSQSGDEESLSGMLLYAKLVRMRAFYGYSSISQGGNLAGVFANNGFSGWSELQKATTSSLPRGTSLESFVELVYQNFVYPAAFGLNAYHAKIASYGPYFNYGYAEYYNNQISNEASIISGVVNGKLPSHLKISGNSNKNSSHLIAVVGNTGYFASDAMCKVTPTTLTSKKAHVTRT